MNLNYRNERNAKFIAAAYNKPLDKPDWYKVNALSDDEAEILVFDYIGWPFNSAEDFIKNLASITQNKITIRINSPGGDVWDANAIYNAIKRHKSKPTTCIESLAASAASYIFVAGHKKIAHKNSLLMIHEPSTCSCGNQFDMRETADVLQQVSDIMVDMYADNTSVGKRELRDMMKAETWMNAKLAKEKGFVDSIIESGKSEKAAFDLSIFSNLPDEYRAENDQKIITGFDVERILHDAKAPKGFAKAAAAACRAAGLFDRRQADDDLKAEEEAQKALEAEAAKKAEMNEIKAEMEKAISILKR